MLVNMLFLIDGERQPSSVNRLWFAASHSNPTPWRGLYLSFPRIALTLILYISPTFCYSDGNGRITLTGRGNLQILDLQPASGSDPGDGGSYLCRAENDRDSTDAEAELSVLGKSCFSENLLDINTDSLPVC